MISNYSNEIAFYEIKPQIIECLTKRQKEILVFVAQGYTAKDIANSIGLSENTIMGHKQRMYRQLNISSAVEAVSIAYKSGLVKL